MERKIIYHENSEEYKAIKLLEQKTKNYSLDGNDLHYALILYNLIVNLSIENQQLKSRIDKAIEYLYKHSQYNDGDGVHYIKEDEYCVDYLLDILKERGE